MSSDVPQEVFDALDRLGMPPRPLYPPPMTYAPPPARSVAMEESAAEADPLPTSSILTMERGEQLEHLTDKALRKADEILSLPLEPSDEQFGRILGTQRDMTASILTLAARVDENRFRKKSVEALQGLLAAVLERERVIGAPKIIAG